MIEKPRTGVRTLGSAILAGILAASLGAAFVPTAMVDEDNGTWDNPKLVVDACEGTTDFDPTLDSSYGEDVNLLGLWGERFAAYDRGESVPLYGIDGSGGAGASPPLCVVRKVDDKPVSSWSYCTDYDAAVCGSYDLEGNIID